jgi:hypothetical protein
MNVDEGLDGEDDPDGPDRGVGKWTVTCDLHLSRRSAVDDEYGKKSGGGTRLSA